MTHPAQRNYFRPELWSVDPKTNKITFTAAGQKFYRPWFARRGYLLENITDYDDFLMKFTRCNGGLVNIHVETPMDVVDIDEVMPGTLEDDFISEATRPAAEPEHLGSNVVSLDTFRRQKGL